MQFNDEQEKFFRLMLNNMRVIAAALVCGVVSFLLVTIFVLQIDPWESTTNTYIAIGAAIVAVVLSFVVPGFVEAPIKQALIEGKKVELPRQFNPSAEVGIMANLLWVYQTRLIITLAILEGAAIYNVIAYLLERRDASLAVAGVLVAIMVFNFPTRGRLESWLADQIRSIEELRNLRS